MKQNAFELLSGETWRDPFKMYKNLRKNHPIYYLEEKNLWILSKFEDVFNAARNPEIFSSQNGLTVDSDSADFEMGDVSPMVFLDPPEHTELRRLVSKDFTPRRVVELTTQIRLFVLSAINRIREKGNCDIINELFKPLPSFVVAHYLGVPPEDRKIFDTWTEKIVAGAHDSHDSEGQEAVFELANYFTELINWRRGHPSDDTISKLVEMGEETTSIILILGFAFTMITGGNDTTTGMLGGSAVFLTENLEQRKLLIDNPTLFPNAIEEFLRLTSPVQGLARTLLEEINLHNFKIPKGSKVLLNYASANRDEDEFGHDAEKLDITRKITRFLTFGSGAHLCLGASAARLQSSIALEELLRHFPNFRVNEHESTYAHGNYVRRHTYLPFTSNE